MAEYQKVAYDNTVSTVDVTYDSEGAATLTQEVVEILLATSSYFPAPDTEPEPDPPVITTLPAGEQ
jgi:hypothetical protein